MTTETLTLPVHTRVTAREVIGFPELNGTQGVTVDRSAYGSPGACPGYAYVVLDGHPGDPLWVRWEDVTEDVEDASPTGDTAALLHAQTVSDLQAAEQRARRAEQSVEIYKRDIVVIGSAIREEAVRRDYCSEYEDSIQHVYNNLSSLSDDLFKEAASRTTHYDVQVSVTVCVEAASESAAVDIVRSDWNDPTPAYENNVDWEYASAELND